MTTKSLVHKCPECSRMFASRTGLGSHRRSAHGIIGQGKSTVAARELAAESNPPLSDYMRIRTHIKEMRAPEHPAPNQCRFCGYQTKSKTGLSIHINKFHAPSKAGDPKAENNALQCPHCTFVATNQGGLALHRNKKHGEHTAIHKRRHVEPAQTQTITIAATHNGHKESHPTPNGIAESTLALALGRFQGLCESMASQFDIPPRSFTAELARLIYATTIR